MISLGVSLKAEHSSKNVYHYYVFQKDWKIHNIEIYLDKEKRLYKDSYERLERIRSIHTYRDSKVKGKITKKLSCLDLKMFKPDSEIGGVLDAFKANSKGYEL